MTFVLSDSLITKRVKLMIENNGIDEESKKILSFKFCKGEKFAMNLN